MGTTRGRIRAWRVHTALFLAGSLALIVLDLAQGTQSSASKFLGLEWAHILILIWIPILATHLALTWWDRSFGELKDVVEVPFAPHRSKRRQT